MIYTKSLVPAQTGADDTIHKDGGISMSHRIITIEREYASGGREIGELIANRLGIPCYNREILKMASGNRRRSSTKELFIYVNADVQPDPYH